MTEWPFTIAELTAGLRRYFAESALKVKSVSEYPLPLVGRAGQVRGLRVEYGVGSETVFIDCVVKEPKGTSRAGLAGAGRREVGVYQSLATQLPMPTPALIAADPLGDWLVLEAVEADIAPDEWTAEDYRQGVGTLAALHERFWTLAEDLSAYKWLARPLTGDFEIHVYAAAQAIEKMILDDRPQPITSSMTVLGALGQMISQVEQVAAPLRAAPQTFLHGDFWPGNVALQADGEMVVMGWQSAGLGPGILDLVTFHGEPLAAPGTPGGLRGPDRPLSRRDAAAGGRPLVGRRVGGAMGLRPHLAVRPGNVCLGDEHASGGVRSPRRAV